MGLGGVLLLSRGRGQRMISDTNEFLFVTESLGNAFDVLVSLSDGHHVEHICIRKASGFHVVNVVTNAHIDCVCDAIFAIDDGLMSASLRHYEHVEDVPE